MSLNYQVFDEGELTTNSNRNKPVQTLNQLVESPLVSALMVTRGKLDFVKRAIKLFENQSWLNKELIIISNTKNDEIMKLINESNEKIEIHLSPKGLTLGNLRNISISIAKGEFICQWDDDDLYHRDRILSMMNVLRESNADAAFLSQLLMYWISKQQLALSPKRIWEGSVIMKRSASITYPSLKKGEDTMVVNHQIKKHKIALVHAPHLYTYCITGSNTWDVNHFERLFENSQIYSPSEADKIKRQLDYFSKV